MAKKNYQSRIDQKIEGFSTSNNEPPALTSHKNNKAGRPNHGEIKKITLSIPVYLLDDIDVASIAFKRMYNLKKC